MKNDKGAIAIFALVAMIFFLIFIMVAYNNLTQKGKTQLETTGVLFDEYISDVDLTTTYKKINAGNLPEDSTLIVKTSRQRDTINKKSGDYIVLDGKIYKIP